MPIPDSRRRGAWLAFIGFLLVAVTLSQLPRGLRPWLAGALGAQLGRQVQLEQLTVDWLKACVHVDGVTVLAADGTTPAAGWAKLKVSLAPMALLSGELMLTDVSVEQPWLHIHGQRDGTHDWQDVIDRLSQRPRQDSSWHWWLRHLTIESGVIQLHARDRSAGPLRIGVQLGLEGFGNRIPAGQPWSALQMALTLPAGDIRLTGHIRAFDPVPAWRGQIVMAAVPLAPYLAMLSEGSALPVMAEQGTVNMTLETSAELTDAPVLRAGGHVEISGLVLRDTTHHQELPLRELRLSWQSQTLWPLPARWPLQSQLGLDDQGQLAWQGVLQLPVAGQAPGLSGTVSAQRIPLAWLNPWIYAAARLAVRTGHVDMEGQLEATADNRAPRMYWQGMFSLRQLGVQDLVHDMPLLDWQDLSIRPLDLTWVPARPSTSQVQMGEASLRGLRARLLLTPEGRLNLSELVDRDVAGVPAKTVAHVRDGALPDASHQFSPPMLRLGRLVLRDARISFRDQFIHPSYTVQVTDLNGVLSDVDSSGEGMAHLQLQGYTDDRAQVGIHGQFNLFRPDQPLDIRADVTGLELSRMSTYAEHYVGYGIQRGKLSAHLDYRVRDRQLSAKNALRLDQLTFSSGTADGEKTASWPLALAVALLTDRHGVIELDVPIAGSLDEPEFSLGGVLLSAGRNLLTRVITAPFSLLGPLLSGSGPDVAWLEFAPGSAELPTVAPTRLSQLVRILNERPGLQLDIGGRADPLRDGQHPLTEPDGHGKRAGSKPSASQSREESENDRLRALAWRRAEVTAGWLQQHGGIDPARIFLLPPRLGEERDDRAMSAARVDFVLRP